MATDVLKIAVAQTESHAGRPIDNVQQACGMVEMAAHDGARLVIFPELFLTGYELDQLADQTLWLAENDHRLAPLRTMAVQHDMWICVGAAVVMQRPHRRRRPRGP